MFNSTARVIALSCAMAGCGSMAMAQSNVATGAQAAAPALAAGAEVIARDAEGGATVRASRIAESMRIDGRLDEEAYSTIPSFGDFVQQEPREGEPATEKTDVWLFFDDSNIYVSARCWDSQPERDVANDMRRDGQGIPDNENFGVSFDTFYDHRNAFVFYVGLAGGMTDGYTTDERDFNRDWNTVWDAKIGTFDGGWTIEMVIPFKSLRYQSGPAQTWGVQFRRTIRWKNEQTFLTRIPAALGRRGFNKVSSEATLTGIEPPPGRTYELKPYGISDVTKKSPTTSTDPNGDFGLDAKVGLTQSLTGDFSYNTDFAQVEVDEQQVNLTRFNILFPEKREFFLEGQGIFSFGGPPAGTRAGVGPGGLTGSNPSPNDIPIVFFSRRIGLTQSQTGIGGVQKVPIDVGGRVTGKSGPYSIGLMDIRTGDSSEFNIEPTNFGAVRIKRDILRRSAIGALFTDRSISSSGESRTQTFGIDGTFAFYENVSVNTYVAKVRAPERPGDDLSYRAQFDYNGDRYGVQAEQLFVDDNFTPDVGFLRRGSFRRNSVFARFSPRPASIRSVRKFTWDVQFDHITNATGRLESRLAQGAFRVELQNGDALSVEGLQQYEFLARPFSIVKDVTIPIGGYTFPQLRLQYMLGPQRRFAGIVKFEQGSFYDGDRTELVLKAARIEVTPQVSVEPGITVDWVDLPEGRFTTKLVTTRATFTVTPRMAVSALTQWVSNTHALGTNVRFRWEYTPGSDLFVVYTDDRDTLGSGFPALQNRSVVVKLTRLFRL